MSKLLAKIVPVLLVVSVGAAMVLAGGATQKPMGKKYKIVLDNAFGLTLGGDLKVGGVKAGTLDKFALDKANRALVSVSITEPGFGDFTSKARCVTRPQSIIGEYFVDCEPGKGGTPLKSGATIPVTKTRVVVPPDLVANILRLPYRERLRIIIGELGAGVSARGGDLNATLRRAVPALGETDKLLKLLGDESGNMRRLVTDADVVIGELARNKQTVLRFVREANKAAQASASRSDNIQATFRRLPGFLQELRPTMVSLGRTADGLGDSLRTLSDASGQVKAFLEAVPPFADASKPALLSLAHASRTGIPTVKAARPLVSQLNRFATHTPELAKNLSMTLSDLDNRGRAVETDPRAARQIGRPGAKVGYTGLEALLQYVFNQSVAINSYDQNGHVLRVDGFLSKDCGPYADAQKAKSLGKKCKAWIGPNQPGINRPDPSDKSTAPSNSPTQTGGPLNGAPPSAPSTPSLPTGGLARKAAAPRARTASSSSSSAAGNNSDLLNYLLAP
jgi:ABC-type transporter Mla subunit MlaD